MSGGEEPAGWAGQGPAQWPTASSHPSRWPTLAALAIAIFASALAIVGWFRPTAPASPTAEPHPNAATFTDQQIADAKSRACGAFDVVQKSVRTQTGASNPSSNPGDNPALTEAQAANARLSVVAGSSYLRNHIEPATPTEIADNLRALSESMSELGEKYLAGAQNDDVEVAKLRGEGTSTAARLAELCK